MAISFCGKRMILTRNTIYKTQKRKNGYIILLPEIGEDLPDKDPLIKPNGFPEFNTFSVERAIAAVGKLSVLYEEGIQKIAENIQGKQNVDIVNDVLNPIEELNLPLETTWGIAKSLYFGNQSLMPTKYYECIHNRMIKARSVKFNNLSLYKACKEAAANKNLNLSAEQRRIIALYTLEGRLNGLDMENEKNKNRLTYLNTQIYKKSNEIRQKIEIATTSFKSKIDNPHVVRDFPEDFLQTIAQDPKNPRQGPWTITLQPNILPRFLEYCPDRELRYITWHANATRGAIAGETLLRTSSELEDVRDYRMKQAKIFGYKSYAHMSMETKVAGNLDNVYSVMDNLLATARPAQEKEIKDLTEFARNREFESDIIRQWDIDYWIRKHRRVVLNFKDEILHQYFPLPHVLKGLFQLIEHLFSIRIVEGPKTDVWHTDVRFFNVIDLTSTSDEPIAHFYLDPYTRGSNKMTKAEDASWMVPIRNKSKIGSTTPLISLIFNFRPPVGNVPSLLSFKDVISLFQEVGNSLQFLLTRVEYSELAGSSNIEWDAARVCGYFMENWLYEPHIIKHIAKHYKSNETLSDEQIESIKQIRSHMAGYKLCKELYYSRFDLELYDSPDFWVKIMHRLWSQHFVMPENNDDSSVTSWTGIFSGPWAAAWYSDLWSRMIAADIYSAFQDLPKNDSDQEKEIAMRFRNTFLSLGTSTPASEVFRQFRGRDPNSRALLKNLSLNPVKNNAVD
ncbi:hypothetical protein PV327_007205 [Microctonus hyperodae]|uniref:Peptidase M3A/M3B catalytic domain-containing protein n=1 Tax=Microctonus hyperodae TaxID=165561 RepID=A0AA39F5X1_MICHY|nr:hypothetical protein PV327_007205 [Microctonus hyperodae]